MCYVLARGIGCKLLEILRKKTEFFLNTLYVMKSSSPNCNIINLFCYALNIVLNDTLHGVIIMPKKFSKLQLRKQF